MTPQQLLLILRARYKIALFIAVVTVAIAIPVIQALPLKYTAITSLVVETRSPDPISAVLLPSTMSTQEDIIKSDRVAHRVVKTLKLDEDPAVRQQWMEATEGRGKLEVWLGELLKRNLAITPSRRDSNILTIEFTAADPVFAAAVANAFAQSYVETSVELKVDPAKQYARWFGEQGKVLRENLEKAQTRLSAFQQKKGIVARDETLDTENGRLAELTSRLTAVQTQNVDSRSRQRSPADSLPEVLQNSVVAGLRSDIARLEARLKDASVNLGSNHPQIRRMQSELAELKLRLEAEARHVASGFTTSNAVGRDTEIELKAAIEAQRKKLLALRSERDEQAVLQRDVEAAKSAYDVVARRYNDSMLQSQATQTNVFMLTPAAEPLEPSSPKIQKFTLMAVFGGIALGIAAAFGLELVDRRTRCVADLREMLQLPVLSVIPRLPARNPRRRLAFWRRLPALPPP